ncbi:MAG: hypothetical protein JNN00_15255 [Chitinophagaceae bacterium]|nr:hypothetical protein [Chitinophagaceae bacterium]
MKQKLTIAMLVLTLSAGAQVKIGNNPNSIDANSLLELESTNKGFLPPRVALNSISSVSPLTGTVPAGMLVFSSGGSLTNGYYYWSGTEWKRLGNGDKNLVTKTASTTLTKTENLVIASNDITLTLPAVTAADNGMEITIKNMGSHTDLITVQGNGGATIDGLADSKLTRYMGETFVVSGTDWFIKDAAKNIEDHLLDVDENSSWTTIQEAIDFLNLHMTGPSVLRLADEIVDISGTIVIDLPYPVTIQGLSFGTTTIAAASGLAGKPMFRCISDCYFKMLQFDATTLAGYGTAAGEDAIRFTGSGTYNEVKDCSFDRFYNSILDSSDAEIWVFECDISNAQGSGILIHSASSGVIVKVAETDFIGCNYGINLSKASGATIQLASGGYYNISSSDTAIFYQPSTFTSFVSISITGNSWNNIGKYIEGFDFTRIDGRDANAIVESNAGLGDKKPGCYLNLLNNTTTTTLTTANSWYKVNWDYTKISSSTCKWTITNAAGGVANVNRITFQPVNKRDGIIVITGNLSVNNSSRTISLGLVKNGVSGTRYGETTLRTSSAGTASQFSTVIYLSDISPNDYFEVFCSSTNSGDIITMLDLNWQVSTQ